MGYFGNPNGPTLRSDPDPLDLAPQNQNAGSLCLLGCLLASCLEFIFWVFVVSVTRKHFLNFLEGLALSGPYFYHLKACFISALNTALGLGELVGMLVKWLSFRSLYYMVQIAIGSFSDFLPVWGRVMQANY